VFEIILLEPLKPNLGQSLNSTRIQKLITTKLRKSDLEHHLRFPNLKI